MAKMLPGDPREVQRDEHSMLVLDAKPVRWGGNGDGPSGLCWSPGSSVPGGLTTWQEAAREGARGLLSEGAARGIHSSLCGIEPVYWIRDGDAVYFATRIHPLVETARSPLTVDWDAWAEIMLLSSPIAPRTPFAEIRRLEPNSLLRHDGRRAAVTVEEWPWLEVEPHPRADVANVIVEEARRAVRAVAGTRVICPLSGGWDSRLLAALLAEERERKVGTWTIEPDNANLADVEFARSVASQLGTRHVSVEPRRRRFWTNVDRCAQLSDYQTSIHSWLVPFADRLRAEPGTVVDGIGGDVWIKGLFLTEEIVAAGTSQEAFTLIWRRIANPEIASRLFRGPFRDALISRARAGFDRAAEPFREHPAGPSLAVFRTRTAGGISHAPMSVLATSAPVATPLIAHGFIAAGIGVPPREKLEGALYRKVLERGAPTVARLPSTNDPGYSPENMDHRPHWTLRSVQRGYIDELRKSPLRPWFSEQLEAAASTGSLSKVPVRGKTRFLTLVAMFGSWHRRYGDRLRAADPDEMLA
jgi:hypothetical protein